MSTFLDEAETSLDACRKTRSIHFHQSVMRMPCFISSIIVLPAPTSNVALHKFLYLFLIFCDQLNELELKLETKNK